MFPWHDFRTFLDYLEKEGQLVRIKKPVSVKHEIAAYIRKSSDVGGPAFLFENIDGYPGWTAAAALYATHRRITMALQTTVDGALGVFQRAVANPIKPKIVKSGPCKEIIWTGAQVDLYKLPHVTHHIRDAGPYITGAVQIAKDPDTGVRGLGIYRMQVIGKDRFAIWAPRERRVGRSGLKSEERGQAQPVAIALGVDPLVEQGSVARVPHGIDKFDIAGGLLGHPVELVKCETIDEEVPADTEIVIEGEYVPNERAPEAPFGEFTGCYSPERQVPVVRAKAITMRRNAIYHSLLTGFPVTEDHLLNWIPLCEVLYRSASAVCPEVKAVNVRGNYVYEALVAIKKRQDGEPYNVMAAVLAGASQAKYCMVVDEDVNIFDDRDLDWALCTRVQPHRDVHIFPIMVGAPLDPSAPIVRHTSKMGIDATIPLGEDRAPYQRCLVPGADEVTW